MSIWKTIYTNAIFRHVSLLCSNRDGWLATGAHTTETNKYPVSVMIDNEVSVYIKQGSYSFEPFKFHDFPLLFPWPFPVFHDFGYSCHLRKFSKLSLFLFRVFTLLSATDNTLVSTICAISKSRLITSFCPYFGLCTN